MSKVTPRDAQTILNLGPFSGSDMYVILYTTSDAGFDAASWGFVGDRIEIKTPEDVAAKITDRRRVLITNGDELFSNAECLRALIEDREKLRHRNLVVIHCRKTVLRGPMASRFIHIEAMDPILTNI